MVNSIGRNELEEIFPHLHIADGRIYLLDEEGKTTVGTWEDVRSPGE